MDEDLNVRAKTIKLLEKKKKNIELIFMILDLAMDSQLEEEKYKQQKQEK